MTIASAILTNNHQLDYKHHLTALLNEFKQEQMRKWKQMLAIEISAAVLAETLNK